MSQVKSKAAFLPLSFVFITLKYAAPEHRGPESLIIYCKFVSFCGHHGGKTSFIHRFPLILFLSFQWHRKQRRGVIVSVARHKHVIGSNSEWQFPCGDTGGTLTQYKPTANPVQTHGKPRTNPRQTQYKARPWSITKPQRAVHTKKKPDRVENHIKYTWELSVFPSLKNVVS